MAEENKTKQYAVRLKKGFGFAEGVTQHRRAGHSFAAGPEYQLVDLTEEEAQAFEDDPAFEFGKPADVKKAQKENAATAEQTGDTEELQDPAKVTGERDDGTTPQTGRTAPSSDPTRSGSPEAGLNAPPPPPGSNNEDLDERETLLQLGRTDLNKTAEQEGVEDAEKMSNKGEVADAILDRRANAQKQLEKESNESGTSTVKDQKRPAVGE